MSELKKDNKPSYDEQREIIEKEKLYYEEPKKENKIKNILLIVLF